MDERLLESLASIISDYRAGEIQRPSKEHIKSWVEQFDENVRDRILAELAHVLGTTYITKATVEGFLSALVTNEKLTAGDAKSFWQGAKLLDIQKKGSSQRDMLAMFAGPLETLLGLEIADCGKTPTCYVYIDDGLFSGNHILGDLRDWLAGGASNEALVHVVVIALHRGGQYYAKTNLEKAAQERGKKIQFKWWRIVELEDRRAYINSSDVLRPTQIPADAITQAYVKAMKHQPVLRAPPGTGELKIFSSDEGRELLEQQFLAKGAYIRTVCPMLNEYQRPLGNHFARNSRVWIDDRHISQLPEQCASGVLGWESVASSLYPEDQLMASETQIRTYNRRDVVVFRMTTGEFGGLSNMAPNFPLEINGIKIATAEALYQACRFPNQPEIQALVVDQPSPMTAKMKSKRHRKSTRDDWDMVRVKIMRWCLRVKLAQNWSSFSTLLLKTGDRPIVEESRKDDFWGAKPQEDQTLIGMNVLGRLLMELREQLQTGQPDVLKVVSPPKMSHFLFLGRPIGAVGPPTKEFIQTQPSMFG